jgi:hypothetical protein
VSSVTRVVSLPFARRIQTQAAEARGLEAPKIAERKTQVSMLQQVVTDCTAVVNRDKHTLAAAGYAKDLTHGELQKRHQRLLALEKEVAPVLARLADFRGLPPDPSLAQQRVAQAEAQLARLRVEFAEEMQKVGQDTAATWAM